MVATALQSPANASSSKFERVEVGRVLREARRSGMLDALVDREDGEVSSATEAAVVEQGAEIAQHGGVAVAVGKDAAQVVGSRERQVLGGKGLGRMTEEGVCVVAEERAEIGARAGARARARAHGGQPTGGSAAGIGPGNLHSGQPSSFVGGPCSDVPLCVRRGFHGMWVWGAGCTRAFTVRSPYVTHARAPTRSGVGVDPMTCWVFVHS